MFQDWIETHREKIISSTQELFRIPSVGTDPTAPHKPFGDETDRALQFMLNLGQSHGFKVKNVDGYAGHIEYGDSDEYVAVLAHLDVVPAGNNWTHPPFNAEIHENQIYARGAIDDKGPAMAAFYALVALKESGLQLKRNVRLILGLDEETDWRCMDHYFKKEPTPWGGFTPDADFPLIYAEKGIVSIELTQPRSVSSHGIHTLEVIGGERPNMVPDSCTAKVVVDRSQQDSLIIDIQQFCKDRGIACEITRSGDEQIEISVSGKSAHGSLPSLGVNAVQHMAKILSEFVKTEKAIWEFVASADIDGDFLGVKFKDEVSGPLTCNLGMLRVSQDSIKIVFDIRYPVDRTRDELVQLLQDKTKSYGYNLRIMHDMEPLYVPKDSPLVKKLLEVYERITGESADPIAIGGGTYARAIPNAVAFGPMFPGMEDIVHQKDERIEIQHLLQITNLYAHAIYELAK